MTPDDSGKSFIIEYQRVGGSTKVTAIDPETLREASIIAPSGTPRNQMAQLAMRKLQYVLGKTAQP